MCAVKSQLRLTRMVGVSQSWAALDPSAEPMGEAAENSSPVSSGVLVTVKSVIYSMKNTPFLAICASKLTATIMGKYPVSMV